MIFFAIAEILPVHGYDKFFELVHIYRKRRSLIWIGYGDEWRILKGFQYNGFFTPDAKYFIVFDNNYVVVKYYGESSSRINTGGWVCPNYLERLINKKLLNWYRAEGRYLVSESSNPECES